MINLLLGSSGSGKSYEAVAFQILPALQRGRKVITNMPLKLPEWEKLDATFPGLIELRKRAQPIRGTWEPTREEGAFNLRPETEWEYPDTLARPFAGVWDYYSDWTHPVTGEGPLFVVDEAQNCIPFRETAKAVEEWTALHRHWTCDVLYLTQSYGKLSKAIRENVQMVYRFRKKIAWGQPDKYIRKVQDGLRGEVLNTTERSYEARYFPLYKSHTQGGSGNEANAEDVKPWWRHWSFMGAAAMLTLGVGVLVVSGVSANPIKTATAAAERPGAKPVRVVEEVDGKVVSDTAAVEEKPKVGEPVHPYGSRGLHVIGSYTAKGRTRVLFAVSQNGQAVSQVDSFDLERLGYQVETPTPCAVKVVYENWSSWVICDAPQVAVTPNGVQTAERPDAGNRPQAAERPPGQSA